MDSVFTMLLVLIALCLVAASFIPLISRFEWWIRIFDFPRVQLAVLSLLALGMMAVFYQGNWYERLVGLLLIVAILRQFYRILPFTPLYAVEVNSVSKPDAASQLSVMVANVLMSNRNTDLLSAIVQKIQPDILLTLETNSRWEKALAPLESVYKYVVRCPQDNLYGMHLYSKLELVNPQIQFLVEEAVPSIHSEVILPCGQRVMLHCLHPAPPSPTENQKSVERDAELVKVARRVKQENSPSIVTGDLNDVAWSNMALLFRKISGLLDPRIGRGIFNTFHAKYWFFRWPLDHLFHSSHFALVDICRLDYFGSDHFPIFCKLQYVPDLKETQSAPRPNEEDQHEADQKLVEARTNPSS